MEVMPGSHVGPYEVLTLIGRGGMGEVWKARDSRLGRDVALKFLPADVVADRDGLARFHREAQILASLNHPHIAALYGVEEVDGGFALVLELVHGATLAEWLAHGPIPLDEALPIAKQIVEALEAAHEAGVIHRDLKPANIVLRGAAPAPRADGIGDTSVKVLDFGLAKTLQRDGEPPRHLSHSPTISSPAMTGVGVILGTAAYMSPEQARGRAVDRRVDVWSFGCVFYEMLTGRRAFPGEDVPEIIGAVIHKEPDWTALPGETPPAIRTLLGRCLQKDRRQRIPDVGVARLDIQDAIAAGPADVSPPRTATPHRERLAWAVAAIACTVAVGMAAAWLRPATVPDPLPYLASILPVDDAPMRGLPPSRFAISPDARHLAFTAGPGPPLTLWVRSLETGAVRQLPGTEGVAVAFWSPDSRFMAFIADGKLKKISISGGPAITLAEAQQGGGGGAWSPGDVIVFSSAARGGLSRIDAGGGPVTAATTLDTAAGDTRHWWPYFLPDGIHFLYEAIGSSTSVDDPRAVYVGSLNPAESSRLVLNGGSNAKYAEGHVLFMRGGTLMAQPFDADRMELTGEGTPVAERVEVGGSTGQSGAFSVSNAGVLVYQLANGSELGHQLAWFDRTGKQVGVVSERAEYYGLELSPDGTRATVSIPSGGTTRRDIWIVDLLRNVRTAFTRHERNEAAAAWWPDGSRIVFNGGRAPSGMDLYVKAASGAGSEELLWQDSLNKGPSSVSRDGQFLIYGTPPPDANLWVLPLTGDRKPIPYMQTPFTEAGGRFSPSGRWVTFASNESGRPEIYVAPFPATGAKILVSTAGAQLFSARWRDDGRELFYLSPEGTLIAAAVDGRDAEFRVSGAKELFRLPFIATTTPQTVYDVSAGGQRFLVNMRPDDGGAAPLTIVFNWTALLTRSSPR